MDATIYKNMYLRLFHAVTNAISVLEREQEQRARAILVEGQRATEEIYMDHLDIEED